MKDPTDDYLEDMMNEAPGPINFTMFLTMFGERLQVIYLSDKFLSQSKRKNRRRLETCIDEQSCRLSKNLSNFYYVRNDMSVTKNNDPLYITEEIKWLLKQGKYFLGN